METEPGIPARSFFGDLGAAIRVVVHYPMLPAISVGLLLLLMVPILNLVAMVFWAGWLGSERLWFLRAFRGVHPPDEGLWRATKAFMGRYIVLGLIFFFVYLLIWFAALGGEVTRGSFRDARVTLTIATAAVDMLLTFVTPALAFSTRSVASAFAIGISTIFAGFPRSLPYVLVPPIAIQIFALSGAWAEDMNLLVMVALAAATTVVTLIFKGGTAAFYAREVGAPTNDGAAFLPRHEVLAPEPPDLL